MHPEFRTAGAIEGYTLAFPRSAVWIEHVDRRPFVADARVVTMYNLGQPYVRQAIATEGDRTDWISLSRSLACAIVTGVDPGAAAATAGPFPVACASSSGETYLRQRILFARVGRGELDDFELEQEVVLLAGAVLEQALRPGSRPIGLGAGRLRELVESTREVLAREPLRRWTVRQLAAQVEISPFHLCRAFRRVTGLTLHHYQLELRTRLALEHIDDPNRNLSRLAQELGFSSHSHFSAAFRRRMGRTPSRARTALACRRAIG